MTRPNIANRVTLSVDRSTLMTLSVLTVIAVTVFTLGPEYLSVGLFLAVGIVAISIRPEWGVATILALLMIQYGQRRFERTGEAGVITTLVPAGEGLMTPNNVLGIYLALLLIFQIYRENDWSFLKNRQIQLVLLIGVVLIASAFLNQVDYDDQAALGLRITGQSPMRALASRALFLLLFVSFIRTPGAFRLVTGIFVVMSLMTAISGSGAALGGGSDVPQAAYYRAGGLGTLIETAGNPNRLAMVATLALVMIWEFTQTELRRGLRWIGAAAALVLVVTVFLTASRGGVIGLGATALMLFMRRRNIGRRVIYGAVMVGLAAMLVSEVLPEAAKERLSTIPGLGDESGEGSGSLQRREYTYVVAYDIWSLSPVVGVGLGNWEYMRFLTDPTRSAGVPHNSYLLAVAEGGVVTLALYLALFGITWLQLGRLARRPDVMEQLRRDHMEWVFSATRVCLFSFMLFSLSADLWELIFFYFIIGLGGALVHTYDPANWQGAPA